VSALDVLRGWNGFCHETSKATTLAILTWRGVNPDQAGGTLTPTNVERAFADAVSFLTLPFGRATCRSSRAVQGRETQRRPRSISTARRTANGRRTMRIRRRCS